MSPRRPRSCIPPGRRHAVRHAAEAALLTGAERIAYAARALAEHAEVVVVSLGAGGALACLDGALVRAPAIQVDAVATTGAGDLLAAASVWGDVAGLDLETRLRWAVLYAALSVTVPTAAAGAVNLGVLIKQGADHGLTPPGSLLRRAKSASTEDVRFLDIR